MIICSELGEGATSEAGKYLFRAANVRWRCAQYFVITSFKSVRAGSKVFALLMLFLWVSLHTMWSGKSL